RHLYQMWVTFGEDIAMLATLVAAVSNMPLKCEIFHLYLFGNKQLNDSPDAPYRHNSTGLSDFGDCNG
ncbi:MAG: hypothetical protein K2K94_10405, partial [Muribaculaceae bacterium]|nr:hypothetical protein [Muribaculaceae bacterium]